MGKVKVSGNALASVSAVLASGGLHKRSDAEKAYDEVIRGVKLKRKGHVQKPAVVGVVRLYTVTTIASSARYGGTRTVAVCTSFERAREMVEENVGDIFELSYRLAVIEGLIADHLYGGLDHEQYWYVWKGDQDGSYKPIEVPAAYENVVGIGIG
jgi:hypothetical protein